MSDYLLKITNLSISFGSGDQKIRAVSNLSLSIKKGQTLGIVGESGSGKSLTSLTTMGLLPGSANIESGEINLNLNGEPKSILQISEEEFRKLRGKEIAMIFQEPMTSLNPVLKCGEQVAEAIRLHNGLDKLKAREEVIKWFNEVQLPRPEQIYESYPHQISGGQKQRVMIAMAMCCNPQLLIADEPTTALDVTVQKKILELIKRLQDKHGMGVIFITHDLGVVAEIADKVLVMQKGEKVEENTCENIFESPNHPYTKGLLACRPPLKVRLKKLPTVQDFVSESKNHQNNNFQSIIVSTEERKEQLAKLFKQEKILEVKNLSKHYPISGGTFKKSFKSVKAVNNISFDVYEGETLGLVGESGCGKTTLGRTILQLLKPTSGEATYKGVNLSTLSERELRNYRKEIQIIFQDPYSSLNPKIKVGDAIVEPLNFHNIGSNKQERKKRVIELMETVGLTAEQYNRYPHEFSGGQRQRVCIARALALSPKFIVCDESVSALDVSVQAQVLNLLNDLKKKFKFTYIFISHDLSVVKYMSDRMLVMRNGEMVELGVAEEVYSNPRSDYTRELINSIPNVRYENTKLI